MEFEINDDCKYIVIASDGVWEFIDNRRVMNIINPYYLRNDPEGACLTLTGEATEQWERVKNIFKYRRRRMLLMILLLL